MKSPLPMLVLVIVCLVLVSPAVAQENRHRNISFAHIPVTSESDTVTMNHNSIIRDTESLSERAINGQFDKVTETYEQEIWNEEHDIWKPPVPSGWSFTEQGASMYWEPDDWNVQSDFHATVYLTHDGEGGWALTTLDATGGQYVEIILGAAGDEEVAVYLDDVLLGTVAGEGATAQFDISNRTWTRSSVLKFIAAGNQWSGSLVRSISLMASTIPPAPVSAFNGTPLSGMIPLEIVFTDESTGSPASWLWDFGDSNTSTGQNPHHTYNAAGTYTVQLTVTNAGGSNTLTKIGYITVSEPAELTIDIRDDSTGTLIFDAWVGLYDYNASEWQNATASSGSIVFLDSGSLHQYPLVFGTNYRVAASADGYEPVARNVTFAVEGQRVTVNLTIQTGSVSISSVPPGAIIYLDNNYQGVTPQSVGNIPFGSHVVKLTLGNYQDWTGNVELTAGSPTASVNAVLNPVPLTYSMTNTFDPIQPEYLINHPDFIDPYILAIKETENVKLSLGNDPNWHLLFDHKSTEVSKEDFGVNFDSGLNKATLHWNVGHGSYSPLPENQHNNGIDVGGWRGIVSPSDVEGKWGDKNKWIVISSCEVLRDPRWAKAMNTTHGILGFETTIRGCCTKLAKST